MDSCVKFLRADKNYQFAGSDKATRNILPNGFYKFLVHNPKEVELLLMHNRFVVFL